MARPKKSAARQARVSQRASSIAPAQMSVTQRLNHIIASGDDQHEMTLNTIRLKCRQLEETIEMVFTAAMREFPDEVLDQPYKLIPGEMQTTSTNSQVEAQGSSMNGTTMAAATTVKKGGKSTKPKSKLGGGQQGERPSRSAIRNKRTPVVSHSLPPKGVITPKFDTRRGRTPSLTRKAKPGEVLVSLCGSPVRSENRLKDKTAAIITLGDGHMITIAPDTDAEQCKVSGKDNIAMIQALQKTLTKIVKNSVKK